MKKLFAFTFAASCLLRPSLVLCLEPSGDVRVEYQETLCCVGETAASDLALDERAANECDGCLDFSLATHSLLKRTAESAPPSFSHVLHIAPAPTMHVVAVVNDAPLTLQSRVLAATIIRR
jgi:hypothetical protein